tara:strand:- start:234 stop:359 length:126 start_codon:yes stop_codon:yes gene_type:complete
MLVFKNEGFVILINEEHIAKIEEFIEEGGPLLHSQFRLVTT